jgi:hypothetical protein
MADLPERTLDAVTKGHEQIEALPGGGWMATGEGVDLFRLVAIRSALRFEVKTGMKMTRQSALKAANAALGTTYRRKQQALDHLDSLLDVLREES